jgi:meso-butanediol dehydrogenase/(S,S)-butanediol dehydrogenase/diacetyl reductase
MRSMTTRLAGKIAAITGTGQGQGRAAALRFAREGATVIGCDLEGALNRQTVEMVQAAGGQMIGMDGIDLGDGAQARAWIADAIAVAGRIDILYNNASACRFATIDVMTDDDWHFTVRNELDLLWYVTKAAWPHMCETGGVILNTASVAGHGGGPGGLAHATTKAGVLAMTRVIAAEGGPHGIRAISITPGVIETPGSAEQLAIPEVKEALLMRMLVSRMGQPEDIAGVAAFLASDEASFITGTEIIVDGGLTNI